MADGGFRLRVCAGPDSGLELLVRNPGTHPVTIGRKAQASVKRWGLNPDRDLLCSDDAVSRRHATIEASARGYLLTDRGSTNGTMHNGHRLTPEVPVLLRDGDDLRFADTVVKFELLEAESERSPRGERPPAPRESAASSPRISSGTVAPMVTLRRVDEVPSPTERFGRYAVYTLLAHSDTDRVEVAVDDKSGARVALKRFAANLPRRVQKRILEEAERARRWRHPNIAEVLDAGVESSTVYVASRLVDGISLATIQERCARDVDPALAAYVVREACLALRYAQSAVPGFVHRNLCPQTIMLGKRGEVVLVNFGFVQLKALVDRTASLSPTEARYLSPEHLKGRGLDPRSDIFSLGVILYELLAQEAIDPRRKAVLADVDSVRPEVPPALADITMRAVAIRPEVRFRTASEMAAELTAALDALAPGYGPEAATWLAKRFPALSVAD